MFDLMLDHPFEPRFLFFGNFQFRSRGTIEGGDDSNDALVVDALSVFLSDPPFSCRDSFGHTLFSRRCDEISDVVLKSRWHLKGGKLGVSRRRRRGWSLNQSREDQDFPLVFDQHLSLQFASQLRPSGETQSALPTAVCYATPYASTLRTTLPAAIRAKVSRDKNFQVYCAVV